MIAIAIIIGVIAAIVGDWLVVVTMVVAVLAQVVSLATNQQRWGRRRPD